MGQGWGGGRGGYALESSRLEVVLVVQVRDKDGQNQDDGGGAGEQQLELGPGQEVEPIKLANILDAKGEGGRCCYR